MRGLIVWFFDDGNICRTQNNYDCIKLTIATCSFTNEDLKKAIDILKINFGFQNISITNRNELLFWREDAIKFCKIALSYLPQGLNHKSKFIREIAQL